MPLNPEPWLPSGLLDVRPLSSACSHLHCTPPPPTPSPTHVTCAAVCTPKTYIFHVGYPPPFVGRAVRTGHCLCAALRSGLRTLSRGSGSSYLWIATLV